MYSEFAVYLMSQPAGCVHSVNDVNNCIPTKAEFSYQCDGSAQTSGNYNDKESTEISAAKQLI